MILFSKERELIKFETNNFIINYPSYLTLDALPIGYRFFKDNLGEEVWLDQEEN